MGKLRIALFGAGRIGSVHFKNMLTNEHALISHVVEMDIGVAKQLVDKYQMDSMVKVGHIDDKETILADPRYASKI